MFPRPLTAQERIEFERDVRAASDLRRRIIHLRRADDTDAAASAAVGAWDESGALTFSAHARANVLFPVLTWAVGVSPHVAREFKVRTRSLLDDLSRRDPTASDVISLATLARLLGDAGARDTAVRLARLLGSEAFARQLPYGAVLCPQMWQLGMNEVVGSYMSPLPALFEEMEVLETGFGSAAQRSHELVNEMFSAKGLRNPLARSPDEHRSNLLWSLSEVVARCLHAAGRNADALAVLRRAGERGREGRARALIAELGLE